ncbi:MAG TPA: DUF6113 family protein [Jiangellaceae bacterium]|nr:DUF6113 family protein [Jiangellaceae bacterium]
MSRTASVLAVTALSVLAVLVGLAGSFTHRWASGGGVVLALGAMVGLMTLARRWSGSRVGMAVTALMWLVPVVVLAQTRPEGDMVIAADARGLVFLFGSVLCAGVGLGLGAESNKSGTIE